MIKQIFEGAVGSAYPDTGPPEDEKDIEIARLRTALRYEDNRFQRIGTHGPDCWKWGPTHFECALRHIKELEAKIENWSNHD